MRLRDSINTSVPIADTRSAFGVPDGRALPIAWSLITNHIPRRYCVGRDRGTGLPLGIGYAARSRTWQL